MCRSRTLLITDNNEMGLKNWTSFLELSLGICTTLELNVYISQCIVMACVNTYNMNIQ